jgi:hypothetical protein
MAKTLGGSGLYQLSLPVWQSGNALMRSVEYYDDVKSFFKTINP